MGHTRKYYGGHYQPRVPVDLGCYGLRLPQVRQQQADLVKEVGISAFCYRYCWFGDRKQLLGDPLQKIAKLEEPDFPLCLGRTNHTQLNKSWNREKQTVIPKPLILQEYPGKKNVDCHLCTTLPMSRDQRYFRIHGKPPFLIYTPLDISNLKYLKVRQNKLASRDDLPGSYLIANLEDISNIKNPIIREFETISLCRLYSAWNIEGKRVNNTIIRITRNIPRILGYSLNKISYKKAIGKIDTLYYERDRVYSNIVPGWDNSPCRGPEAFIFHKATSALFRKHVKMILNRVKDKPDEDKIIFLESWNEWAEGDYMEPDLKWGKGYIRALREALEKDAK